ncbi:MAG TPA: cytochrome C oxidase subunit I [Burkholderiales bacterium]|nr:cytochrome C oxidase subunit I [Burkholderiales bacterium]
MKRSRKTLVLLATVCVAPIALAWLAFVFGWAPGNPGNYGELLAPRRLSAPILEGSRGKWVMVSFDLGACDAYCERKLYFLRQIRKAQGNERFRVSRLWIILDAAEPAPALLAAIEGTQVVRLPDAAFLQSFPGNPADHIYLIDPLGNLMMRYPRNPDPEGINKDLKRLLKYSSTG